VPANAAAPVISLMDNKCTVGGNPPEDEPVEVDPQAESASTAATGTTIPGNQGILMAHSLQR